MGKAHDKKNSDHTVVIMAGEHVDKQMANVKNTIAYKPNEPRE